MGTGVEARDFKPIAPLTAVREPGVESGSDQIAGSIADVFTKYVPSVRFDGAKPHPSLLAESVAMRSVSTPPIRYTLSIDPKIITEGKGSDAQLEAAALAGQTHEYLNADGSRRAIALGDGTGVGKSREAALIVIDNYNKGRKLSLWLTPNDKLGKKVAKHFGDLGFDKKKVHRYKPGKPLPAEGVVVLTYKQSTLDANLGLDKRGKKSTKPNLEIIAEHFGPEFDGPIIMDEAHVLGGANNIKESGSRGTPKDSAIGGAAVTLQAALPQARVAYLTATAASDPGRLGWATRLGLFGKGTSFPTFANFARAMKKAGTAALEALALELKMQGSYLARQLALSDGTEKGSVKVERLNVATDARQRAVYKQCSQMWRRVLRDMNRAAAAANPESKDAQKAAIASSNRSQLFGAQQSFFNTLITSFKVPALIKSIEADLAAGRSSVVQLTRTFAAATDKAIAEADEDTPLEELDISPIEGLASLFYRIFPVHRFETFMEEGKKKVRMVTDSAGNPIEDPEAVEIRDALIADLKKMRILPKSPIDTIIDHFGEDLVAEVTGRAQRLVTSAEGKAERKPHGDSGSNADAESFAQGKKRVLIFSKAGGTGLDYHASRDIPNQQHRRHYLLEPGWQADAAIQGLGRTHRTNQESAPTWILVATDVAGEARFISTIAKRLEQMGAITKGTRKGEATGIYKPSDNMESNLAIDAGRNFLSAGQSDRLKTITRDALADELGLNLDSPTQLPTMRQLLNRMLMLDMEHQDKVFGELTEFINERIEIARSAGTLDSGIEDYRADGITAESARIVHTDPITGASSTLTDFVTRHRTRPLPFADLQKQLAALAQGKGDNAVFVRNKSTGRVLALVEALTPGIDRHGREVPRYRAYTTEQGRTTYVPKADVGGDGAYSELARGEAVDAWNKELSELPTHRKSRLHLITGLLLPLHNELGDNVKIIRVTSDDGTVYLGRQLKQREYQSFLNARGLSEGTKARTSATIAESVLSGQPATLSNGLALERRKVGGETRLEITGVGRFEDGIIGGFGAFSEKVGGHSQRWFIPVKDGKATPDTIEVLDQLLKYSPFTAAASEDDSDAYKPNGAPLQQSARGKPVTTAPDASPRKITAEWIVRWMADRFDVPIRYGRISLPGAAGIYKAKSEVIRVRGRFWGNLYVHSHEVAHHIDQALARSIGKKGKLSETLSAEMKTELGRLDYEPEKARAREGFAEFIARSFANNEDLAAQAPLFSEYFYGTLLPQNPRLSVDLHQLRAHIRAYQSQTALERVKGKIKDDGRPERIRPDTWLGRFREDLTRFRNFLYEHLIEQGGAVARFQNEMRRRGEDPESKAGAFDMYRHVRRAAMKWGADAFSSGAFLLDEPGNIMGPSIGDVFKSLDSPADAEDAVAFAVARHSLDMEAKGVASGIDKDDAQAVVDQFAGREDFVRFHDALSMMNDVLLDLLVEQRVISDSQAKSMRDTWGASYLPMLRVQQLDGATKKAFEGSILRRRSGSGAPIVNPIAATMWKYMSAYRLAGLAQLKNSIIDAGLRNDPSGRWVEPYTFKQSVVQFSPEEIRAQLEAAGLDPGAFDNVDPEATIAIMRPDLYADRAQANVWQRYENGKLKQYWIDPDLAEAVAQLTSTADANAIYRALAAITRIVATGATVLNPNFIVRNALARDAGTYLLQGEGNILERLAAIPFEYYKAAAHFSGAKPDPARVLFDRMHASTTAIELGLRPGAKQIARSVRPPAQGALGAIKGILLEPQRALIRLGEITESVPRMAAFVHTLNKAGFDRMALASGRYPPLATQIRAANVAADATTDFSKRGGWANQMGVFMFFNPIVQGPTRVFKNFTDAKLRRQNLPYIAAAAVAVAGYWCMVRDTDWWRAADDWVKKTHILGPDAAVRWPLPQEFAHFVYGPIISALEGLYQKDKNLPDELLGQLRRSAGNQVPSVPSIQPAIEVAMNFDLFRERAIETEAMRQMKPIDRVNPSTTHTARYLANLFLPLPRGAQLSPVQIEHLLNGYTGGAFRTWVRPMERVAALTLGGKNELSLRDAPGIQGFILHTFPSADLPRFYDELATVRETVGSLKNRGVQEGPAHDRLHELERYAEIMNQVRRATASLSTKEDRMPFDRSMIGLARRALNLTELESFPDPIRRPAAEQVVRAAVESSLARDVVQATDAPPTRQKFEPAEKFRARVEKWRKERDRAVTLLQSTEYTYADLSRMLTQKAKSAGWNTRAKDASGNDTAFRERQKRLRSVPRAGPSASVEPG